MWVEDEFTEKQWLTARTFYDAEWMIRRIWQDTERPSVRKSQMFACHCARACWHLLDPVVRKAVEVAEQYVDDPASRGSLETCRAEAFEVYRQREFGDYSPQWRANIVGLISASLRENRFDDWKAAHHLESIVPEEATAVIAWIHDIFGNPLRPQTVEQSWRCDAVRPLAEAIYTDRAFDRLPILADALEEAGCTDAAILEHCRGPGPHVRGCWVVDLILDKS